FHAGDVVEIAHHISSAERLAGLDGLTMQLLNEADVAALVTPGFGGGGGIKSHSRQPWARPATDLQLISADKALGQFAFPPLVEKTFVGAEILEEFFRLDRAVIAQMDVGEVVPLLVPNMTRHVNAIED